MPQSTMVMLHYPSLKVSKFELQWHARWSCWHPEEAELLVVGDSGRAAIFGEGEVKDLQTRVGENLRCASFSPDGRSALAVGNNGLLMEYKARVFDKIPSGVTENLRRVIWSPDGSKALIIGNDGTALLYDPGRKQIRALEGARNNLRGAVWPSPAEYPIVVGNAFSGPFIPSPNVYRVREDDLEPLAEIERADLIGIDWSSRRPYGLIVGYDLVWHEPRIFRWKDGFQVIETSENQLYPTAVGFHPREDVAIIATGYPDLSKKRAGRIFLYRHGKFERLMEYRRIGFTCVCWSPDGSKVVQVASKTVRTFNT